MILRDTGPVVSTFYSHKNHFSSFAVSTFAQNAACSCPTQCKLIYGLFGRYVFLCCRYKCRFVPNSNLMLWTEGLSWELLLCAKTYVLSLKQSSSLSEEENIWCSIHLSTNQYTTCGGCSLIGWKFIKDLNLCWQGWWTFCSPNHFAPWNTLLPNSLCFSIHFTPQHTLLFSTLCISAHFATQQTLLLRTFCSLEYFAPWNPLLHGTLYFMEHFTLSVPVSKVCWGGQFAKEESVPGSKVFQGAECSRKQSVLRSKVF